MANLAYKFRIYPDEAQRELISKTFGCCRKAWNLMLADKMGVNWKHGKDIALKRGAFAGMVTALVCNVVYIIPLAWMIPMMVVGKGVMDGRKANTVAYGVCTLLFVNLASGVMLLCAEKQDKAAFRAADHLDHPACGAPQQQPQVNISNYYNDGKPANPGNQGWND